MPHRIENKPVKINAAHAAAIGRISSTLSVHVTNADIDDIARQLRFPGGMSGNKAKKLHTVLWQLVCDRRSHRSAEVAIVSLMAEAHRRTLTGAAALTIAEIEQVVEDMRTLDLAPGELGSEQFLRGLDTSSRTSGRERQRAKETEKPATEPSQASRYDNELERIRSLATMVDERQQRGRELELIVGAVLAKEGLAPAHNIVNPGEQIDLAFSLDGQHYLVECRWRQEPQGLPAVRDFSDKVRRKAEGTFGVLLSMSGFVEGINTNASAGSRLNCIGFTHRELIAVLEGQTTLGAVVRRARQAASHRGRFYEQH